MNNKPGIHHERYHPIDQQLRLAIIRSVARDKMRYNKASKLYGVSKGSIAKIIKELYSGKLQAAKQRGLRVEPDNALAYEIVVELAKMTGFKPSELTRICLGISSRRTERFTAIRTQIRRLLEKDGLSSYCINKRTPGVVALHMVKVCWNNEGVLNKKYLLMAMELGTGKFTCKPVDRITTRRIVDCIDDLVDEYGIECNTIIFTTNMEMRRTGDMLVSVINRIPAGDFRQLLHNKLLEDMKDKVEIIAAEPVMRNRDWLRIEGINDNPNAIVRPIDNWLAKYDVPNLVSTC